MRKIRLWIFFAAIWVAKKACYNGLTYDLLNDAREMEEDHYDLMMGYILDIKNGIMKEDDVYYDHSI